MKKKLLSALLCVSMVATMAAGCGSKEEPAAENNTPATEAADAGESAGTEASDAGATDAAASAVDTLVANTTGTVTLRVTASEEDQELTAKLLEDFKAQYPTVTFDIQLVDTANP